MRVYKFLRVVSFSSLLVLANSCSSTLSRQREALLLSSRPPPKGQPCSISPDQPPELSEVVDSAGLYTDLAEYWEAEKTTGYALLSVAIDSTGELRRPLAVIESDLPDTTSAMLAYLATQRVKRVAGHFRLKLDLDSTPSLAPGCSEFCRPELDNREEISRVLGGANTQAQRSGRVMLWVFVTGAGRVSKIEIRESSGDDMVDGLAMGVARAMRFKPATADYVPVPVWVAIPVTLGR